MKKTKTKRKNQTFLFSLIVFVIDDHQVAAAELNQGHLGAEGQIRTRPGWDSVHLVGDKPAGLQPSVEGSYERWTSRCCGLKDGGAGADILAAEIKGWVITINK